MRFAGELTLDFCEVETLEASREDVERAAGWSSAPASTRRSSRRCS
jgi:hypothetical protein